MADDDDGAGKLSDDFFKLFYRSYIQMVRRFIQKQDIRLSNQRSGQRCLFKFAAGCRFRADFSFYVKLPGQYIGTVCLALFCFCIQPRQNDVLKRFVF